MSQKASTTIPLDRLPLGFRFRPTDEELINNYLKLKINGRIRPSDAAAVAEVDVCRLEPWDLPARSAIKSDDQEWFFFAPVDRKYPSGNRSNRATEAGYWKATGKDRFIRSRTRGGTEVVGMKKTLVFHKGRAPRGERTHWIMHEYRTVEREFEEGGFVLCRLFRKSEEKVPGTNTPELEGSGFSPIPTKFSPINTLHIDDVVEGEYAAPLNEKYPVSDMQEESRPLPGTNNNQLTDSKQDDKAYYLIPCPNKSEESQSNDNTTIDERGQMAERKDSSLYDELPGFLGPEYEHIFSDQCLQFNSISYDIDEELPTQLQYAELEEDSVSDFLESMLSTPEISSGLSGNETSLATMAVSGRFGAAHEGSWNSFMDNDACSSRNVDYDPLILIAQVGDPAVSSQERQLLGASESLQMGISDRLDEIRGPLEILGTVKSSSRELASPIESGTLPSHSSQHVEDSVGRTNCLETEINIRLRDLEKLESSTDVFVRHQSSTDVFVRHQGTADRRFKLQESLKSIEKKRQRRSSIVNDEVGKVVKNQTTTGNEVSEPARTNRVAFQSRVDGFSPDVQTALSLQEPVKPRSRSRRRSVVLDNKMEGPTLHVATSRVRSVSTLSIGVAVLAIASLIFAGAVWYLHS